MALKPFNYALHGIRDPRKDPRPGDEIYRYGLTLTIKELVKSEDGTVIQIKTDGRTFTPATWRKWANDDAIVAKHGKD